MKFKYYVIHRQEKRHIRDFTAISNCIKVMTSLYEIYWVRYPFKEKKSGIGLMTTDGFLVFVLFHVSSKKWHLR